MKSKIKILAETTEHHVDILGGILMEEGEPVVTVKEALDAMQVWGEQVANGIKKGDPYFDKPKDEQPIPVNQDEKEIENFYEADLLKEKQKTNYWKKRCEAAEKVIENYSLPSAEYYTKGHPAQVYNDWQQLKSSPSPTPVQEGLREDELWDEIEKKNQVIVNQPSGRQLFETLKAKYTIQLK